MANKKTVLVGGATGHQGGAVVNKLLDNGHSVVAYVQDDQSQAAQSLHKKGVALAVGDLRNASQLEAAAAQADAIFSITVPFGPDGPMGEVVQGKNLADVAEKQNKHLVYSSIAGAKPTANLVVEHASSKQQIEAYFATKPNLKQTVIGPVYLMENLLNFKFNGLERGVYAQPLSPDKKINQVTVLDIAGLAVWEIAQILSEVIGRHIGYYKTPIEQIRQAAGNEIATMYEKFETNPYKVDIAALRNRFPEIKWHSFKQWAETLAWKTLLPG